MFDVFVPRNKQSGLSEGFGFVHYKTEWDTKKAISTLCGNNIGGREISVQMAKYDTMSNQSNGVMPRSVNKGGKQDAIPATSKKGKRIDTKLPSTGDRDS